MKRNETGSADVEPHVFDQTNGLVDLGPQPPEPSTSSGERDRTVSAVAMLSTQKP